MKNKIILILTLFFSFFLNYESKSQCVISTSPSCLEVGNNILISVNNAGGGVQVLYNGAPVFQSTNTPFIFTPNNPGSYFIQYSGGFFGPFCSTTIQVTDQPIELSLTNDTTLLCSGGNIDYNSLGISTLNSSGSVSYNWTTSPNNLTWSGLTNFSIPSSETSVILTVTDDSTGCSDSETIYLTYQSTNANASFISSTNTINCPGQILTFTANNINTNLFSYSWEIDGLTVNGGTNGILNANVYPSNNLVDVTLIVTELSNGCTDEEIEILNVNTPDYVAFDLDSITNPLENGYFDQNIGCFTYCSDDSVLIDTFYNVFTNTDGIDSVIINNGFTQQTYDSTTGFNQFYINLSESVNQINITTYFDGVCDSVTIDYCVLFNETLSGLNVNFGTCLSSNLCLGDTVNYFIDPQQFQMPLNGVVHFVIKCDDNNIDSVTWDYDDFNDNTYFVDADCNPITPDVLKIVFPYVYNQSSCGCYFYDDVLGAVYDKYRVIPIFESYCDTIPMTLGLLEYIPPDPTASFVIPDSICPGGIASISNNSDFGCQNSLNPNYQPDNYVDVSPSFYYDWGNCSTSTYIPSEGQYEDQNFISAQNTNIYNSPGTYYIELSAINSCITIDVNDSINVFPPPVSCFTSSKVCHYDTTKFMSYDFLQ